MSDACWSDGDRARILDEVIAELWRFAGRHARDYPLTRRLLSEITGLTPEALDRLRHIHLLLSVEVTRFVDEALPALRAHARPVAPPRPALQRGAVQGTIAWGATTAARARQGGGDRSLFVTSTPRTEWDTPELRLMRALLEGLQRSCATVLETVAGGHTQGWTATVARIERAVLAALQEYPFLPAQSLLVSSADVAACRRSPRTAIRLLTDAYTRYHALVVQPASTDILQALVQRVLVPLEDDALYELWVLVGAVRVFDDAGWMLQASGLIGPDPIPLTYRSLDGTSSARLWFGHTPAVWRAASRYRAIFERYGVSGATRRPDLIIELKHAGERRYLLVEVKRTRDRDYIGESIYKALGYLADFERVFSRQHGPRALLVLWDGVAGSGDGDDALIVTTHRTYYGTLRDAIRRLTDANGSR